MTARGLLDITVSDVRERPAMVKFLSEYPPSANNTDDHCFSLGVMLNRESSRRVFDSSSTILNAPLVGLNSCCSRYLFGLFARSSSVMRTYVQIFAKSWR